MYQILEEEKAKIHRKHSSYGLSSNPVAELIDLSYNSLAEVKLLVFSALAPVHLWHSSPAPEILGHNRASRHPKI